LIATPITKLNQALTNGVILQHISLVGCNLASNNPTDDSTSAYGAEMLQKLKGIGERFHYLTIVGLY
jgi:hypothetical protein